MSPPNTESRISRAHTRIAHGMNQRLVDAIGRDGQQRAMSLDRVLVLLLSRSSTW